MHIDLESLSLSVLKTSQALAQAYGSTVDNKYECDPIVQLVRIYLVQFVVDEQSPYSARVREQSLEILRSKIEKKEYVSLGNVVKDPKALSITLSQICNDLIHEVKSVEHLITNFNNLDEIERAWKTLLQVEESLGQRQASVQHMLVQQLGYGISPEDPAFERFKHNLSAAYNQKMRRVRMGLQSGNDLIQTCEKEEQKFATEVRHYFMQSLDVAEKKGLVSDEFKSKTLQKIDRWLQQNAQDTVGDIQTVMNSSTTEANRPHKNKI